MRFAKFVVVIMSAWLLLACGNTIPQNEKDEMARRYGDMCQKNIDKIRFSIPAFRNLPSIENVGGNPDRIKWEMGKKTVNKDGREVIPARLWISLNVWSNGKVYTETIEIGVHFFEDEFGRKHVKTIYPEYIKGYEL